MNPIARPTPARLKRLGMTGARLVAQSDPAFFAYAERLNRAGMGVAIVLTGSSFASDHYEAVALDYRDSLRFSPLWFVANEWNISGAASWPPGGDDAFVSLYNAVARGLVMDDATPALYIGGMFSEPDLVGHVERLLTWLEHRPTGVVIHPYMDEPDAIEAMCGELHGLGLQVIVGEWNDSRPWMIGPFQDLLNRCSDGSFFLPWTRAQTITEAQPLPGLVSGTHTTALGKSYSNALRGAG